MALGTYTVPDSSNAGADDSCKGSGSYGETQGLQLAFANELNDAMTDVSDDGLTITTGYSGYVSLKSATDWADNGNGSFLSAIGYFGWGLAAEIENIDDSSYTGSNYTSDIESVMSSHNLEISGDSSISYIRPSLVTVSSDATAVTYDSTATTSSSTSSSSASVGSIAYFFSNQYSSVKDETLANTLKGNRALANDKTLWSYVSDAVSQSLRVCTSGPNGEFLAWYPDYWGQYENKTPYLELADIELQNLTITQSDNDFYSHVYCSGVTASGTSVPYPYTQGVVSIESDPDAELSSYTSTTEDYEVSDEVSAILKELIYIPDGDEWKYTPKELYRRYGARPLQETCKTAIEDQGSGTENNFEDNPSYILPFLKALNDFMKHWAMQYTASLSITFMPELFPGCRINIASLGISLFVESVTHNMDYQTGFTTTVTCSCPIGTLVPGMVNTSTV